MRQTGARELSVAEHYKIHALAEKLYESIRSSQVDIELIAKKLAYQHIESKE